MNAPRHISIEAHYRFGERVGMKLDSGMELLRAQQEATNEVREWVNVAMERENL